GPADPAAGRLDHAANRPSRGSRSPVYDGGGTWGGSRMLDLRRRDFITLLGGAAAWPIAARAPPAATPVIGFLRSTSPADSKRLVTAFHQGLKEAGFVHGQNVAIEYRWAENQRDRLPTLVTELIRLLPAVIVGNTASVLAAKAATTTVPIVFASGSD